MFFAGWGVLRVALKGQEIRQRRADWTTSLGPGALEGQVTVYA